MYGELTKLSELEMDLSHEGIIPQFWNLSSPVASYADEMTPV